MSSVDSGYLDSTTNILACIQEELKWITAQLRKKPFVIDKTHPNLNERLGTLCETLMPNCIHQVAQLERQYNAKHKNMLLVEEELKIAKSELNRLEESKITRTEELIGEMDHIRKIHGHKHNDEGDPEKSAVKYSILFKSTFDPLYDTLEGTTFNLSEDESSFVVNRMFQIMYAKCTELMISKMSNQLLKLFVQQRELSDIEKERMTDTQYAFGLLFHAANIQEYRMSDDIDKDS